MSLRVLHILNELKPSGAEEMLRASAAFWRAHDVDAVVLATGETEGRYAPVLRQAGYEVQHLPFSKDLAFFHRVRRLIRRGHYDVAHIHCERGDVIYAAAARAAGVRVTLRTIHHIFPYTGKVWLSRFVQRWLNRHVLRTRYVCNSHSGARNERERFRNDNPIVPNWFDERKFRPPTPQERTRARQELGLADDAFALVSVGACWHYKNHGLVLEALPRLPEELGVHYLHAGQEGPDAPERRRAEQLGVTSRTRFLGVVPDALALLHAADAYVMPSSLEGFGVAAVEAMAAGAPAILSDVPALNEFRAHVGTITWVQPRVDDLVAGIITLATMAPDTRRATGLAASDAVVKAFGVERGASAYLALYRQPWN